MTSVLARNTEKCNMEFGSDFHYCDYTTGRSLLDIYRDANLYIDGRQALIDIIRDNKWRCIWVPSYYCYEFIESVIPYIEVKFYDYTPYEDLTKVIHRLEVSSDDAIVIANFFGISTQYDFSLGCTIIEDHSHDLISDWAKNSKADWCFASLRKTLPIADGGILWSPKGHTLPTQPSHTVKGEELATNRYRAMTMKRQYLNGEKICKEAFREIYIQTENEFGTLPISSISHQSMDILSQLDVTEWYNRKKRNWKFVTENILTDEEIRILMPINCDCSIYPFSIVMQFRTNSMRDNFRSQLIKNEIYPAILWDIPEDKCLSSQDFSRKMLSIHCDGRYSVSDIVVLTDRINNIIQCLKS